MALALCSLIVSCDRGKGTEDLAWSSYLLGSPEIPCAQDSDCAVGSCNLDGCSSLVRTLRAGARKPMLRKIDALRSRCGQVCSDNFYSELETAIENMDPENSIALLRLVEALSLHKDPQRAQGLIREKIAQVTDPEIAYALQLWLARLGDLEARLELARTFPCGDTTVDLMLLSSGVARDAGAEKLCAVINDGTRDASLRALARVELCRLGASCGQEIDSELDVRLLRACGGIDSESL